MFEVLRSRCGSRHRGPYPSKIEGMTQEGEFHWYSVRCVFATRSSDDTDFIYEERITTWLAPSFEAAVAMAEEEAEEYTAFFERQTYVGLAQAFWMFDTPRHGAEVFSLMRDSALEPEEYLSTFFTTGAEHMGTMPESPGD